MTRFKTLVSCVFVSALLIAGCGDDDTTGPGDDGDGNPPAAMVGTWIFQSVTVNGAADLLADVMEWFPGTVESRIAIQSEGGYQLYEVDAGGTQTLVDNGFVFVDGNDMDINSLQSDGVTIDETTVSTFTLSGSSFTIVIVEEGDTITFALTR